MLTVQLWSPDTCECVIHQAFDDTVPGEVTYVTREEAMAIHVARRQAKPTTTLDPKKSTQPVAQACPAHAHLGETPAKHEACMEENKRKNITLDLVIRNKLDITDDVDLKEAVKSQLARNLHLASPDDFPDMDGLADKFVAGLYKDIRWSFDTDRSLVITHTATPAEKQRLTARLSAKFPPGRVRLG
mgnify:FL=1